MVFLSQSVVIRLLESCKKYVMNKKSNLTNWHPIIGWFSHKSDERYQYTLFTRINKRNLYTLGFSCEIHLIFIHDSRKNFLQKCTYTIYIENLVNFIIHLGIWLYFFLSLNAAMPHVKEQIKLLWSDKMIKILFSDLLSYVDIEKEQAAMKKEPSPSKSK